MTPKIKNTLPIQLAVPSPIISPLVQSVYALMEGKGGKIFPHPMPPCLKLYKLYPLMNYQLQY